MADYRIGIVGGSGVYGLGDLGATEEREIDTPYGKPSGPVTLASLNGRDLAFLPRHGAGHVHSPTEVPYAANVYALKAIGVRWIISITAVGSLRERIAPRHFLIPDQIYDRTRGIRRHTFYGDGVVGHVSFAEPFCPALRKVLAGASSSAGATVHEGGTYVCIEGPQFSTRAESNVYRSMGMDVIGMTVLPEAKLAREAGICYAAVALVTDYDVWRSPEEDVSVDKVIENIVHNTETVRRMLPSAVASVPRFEDRDCGCSSHAGESAIITAAEARDPETLDRLSIILEP
jgi:5'-methylthioadenosine phosphorylase